MKILLVFGVPEKSELLIGGVETWMLSLSSGLRQAGHHCELFFLSWNAGTFHLPRGWQAHTGNLADLLRVVEASQFDIVHADVLNWDFGISAVRSLPHRPRLILTHHGATHPAWNSANCDAIVGCSRWGGDEQQMWADLRVDIVPNGVSVGDFVANTKHPENGSIVAWVGRGNDPVKGIDRVASIAPILRRSGIRLWIADPSGVEGAVPSIADSLTSNADFWGTVPRTGMADFYRDVAASGGCILSTSKSEGLPLALLEAQSYGCPVIGPNVRGVNECVDPQRGGILYSPGISDAELAELILDTLADVDQHKQRRAKCYVYVRDNFGICNLVEKYVEIYRRVPSPRLSRMRRVRRWLKMAPLISHRNYVKYRLRIGYRQLVASEQLASRQDWELSWSVLKSSVMTSPTMYLRPHRFRHLVSVVRQHCRTQRRIWSS